MQALVYHGPHQMRWEDWPDPVPGPGDALLEVLAVGICGSDVHGYTGQSGRRQPPMVMGHEVVGRVVAAGSAASQAWLGRQAVVQPILFCGACDQCQQGSPQRCRSRRFLGGNLTGAMAERVSAPAANLLQLPENLSAACGTLVEPLAVGIHAASRAGSLTDGKVVIVGCGPIGLLTLVAVRRAGARLVIATDIDPARRAQALRLGADAALDPAVPEWRRALGDLAGGEVDVTFDAVGIAATFGQALEAVRPGGQLVAIGGWQTVPVDLGWVVPREVSVVGTFNYTPAEFAEALAWLAEGRLPADELIAGTHPLEEGAKVFADLAAHGGGAGKTVLTRAHSGAQ